MSPARWFFVPFIVIAHIVGFIFALVPALIFMNYAVKQMAYRKRH